jgi:hypothetical protein
MPPASSSAPSAARRGERTRKAPDKTGDEAAHDEPSPTPKRRKKDKAADAARNASEGVGTELDRLDSTEMLTFAEVSAFIILECQRAALARRLVARNQKYCWNYCGRLQGLLKTWIKGLRP